MYIEVCIIAFIITVFSFNDVQSLKVKTHLQSSRHIFTTQRHHHRLHSTYTDWELNQGQYSLETQSASPSLRNLRQVGRTPLKEDPLLRSWNELKGLSKRDLLELEDIERAETNRESKALSLAYRRCEYVTQLFSKTFYMGTSLMESAARQHVWAIYAWCRRTGMQYVFRALLTDQLWHAFKAVQL
jgi:hypothetical protein